MDSKQIRCVDPAFGPDGDLYVAVGGSAGSLTNSVLRYDGNTGVYEGVFASQAYLDTTRDLVFRNGKLYVADLDANAVKIFDGTTGAYLGVFASHSQLVGPEGIVFGADGNMYVTGWRSNNVVRFNGTTGAYIDTFISGISAPTGIEFINGNFFVTSQTNQVRWYSATGSYLGAIGSSADGLSNPLDIAVGPGDGLLYVTSGTTSRVLRYNVTTNAYVDDFVPAGTGGLSYSRSLTFHNGDLFVTSIGNDDVLRFGSASKAVFTVTLALPSSHPVTVNYATTNGTATAGTDYTATSGTLTFAPGQTTQTLRVPVLNDSVAENPEAFTLVLSNPVGAIIADGTGVATIADDDTTKFFVVNDGSPDQTYRYGAPGNGLGNSALGSGNTAPRGAASTAAGDKVWVVDANKNVYVYSAAGALLGSWAAGSLASNAQVEGITVWGNDVWIVDAKQDRVYRYAGAASRTSGSQNAASSFSLNSGNKDPKDLVTDGASIWVVNDAAFTDKVFKYTLSGSLLGSWTMSGGGGSPTGITLDPTGATQDLWVVDNATDRVYRYVGARSLTTGSAIAAASFALAPGNTNPQGIADPPAAYWLPADGFDFAPIDVSARRGKPKRI